MVVLQRGPVAENGRKGLGDFVPRRWALISTQIFDSLKNVYIKFNSNCRKMLIIVTCCVLAIHVKVHRTTPL